MPYVRFSLVALLGAVLSCGAGTKGSSQTKSTEQNALLERIDLKGLIPAPGLIFAIQLKPTLLLENSQLARDWEPVFSSQRLEAYQHASGFNLRQIQDLWIIGYPLGTLLLVDAKDSGNAIEQAFIERASTIQETRFDNENARLLTGIRNGEPQALYHRVGDFVALAEGDIALLKIVRGYSLGRITAKSATETRFLSPLANFEARAPLRAFLVGPFASATDAVVQGFAAGAAAVSAERDTLNLQLSVRGVWPDQASEPLTTWLRQLLDTRESRALGLGFPIAAPTVSCEKELSGDDMELTRCTTRLQFNSAALARAIYGLTQAPTDILLGSEAPLGWRSKLLVNEEAKADSQSSPETPSDTETAPGKRTSEDTGPRGKVDTGQP